MMNFLFDITHPAHLHFFRNLVARLRGEGHEVLFTGRDTDILVDLAARHGLEMEVFGKAGDGGRRSRSRTAPAPATARTSPTENSTEKRA